LGRFFGRSLEHACMVLECLMVSKRLGDLFTSQQTYYRIIVSLMHPPCLLCRHLIGTASVTL
jgi:hypothetical protein